jgi:DNA polymerase IIIc chi subunit
MEMAKKKQSAPPFASYLYLPDGEARELADGTVEFIYTVLPVGSFYDSRFGWVWIDDEKAKAIAGNFGKYPSYPPPIKIGHGNGAPSPGRITAVTAVPGEGVSIAFSVDAKTAGEINEGLYRYMSAEFVNDYVDRETGKPVGPVLIGAALVNQPGHPGVVPFKLSDGHDENAGGENVDLAELQARIAEMEGRVAALTDENKGLTTKLSEADVALAQAAQEKRRMTVQAFSDKWSSQGVPPALLSKVAPLLERNGSTVVALADDGKEVQRDLMEVLEMVFADMPKVKLALSGDPSQRKETDPRAEEVAHGQRIAAAANR